MYHAHMMWCPNSCTYLTVWNEGEIRQFCGIQTQLIQIRVNLCAYFSVVQWWHGVSRSKVPTQIHSYNLCGWLLMVKWKYWSTQIISTVSVLNGQVNKYFNSNTYSTVLKHKKIHHGRGLCDFYLPAWDMEPLQLCASKEDILWIFYIAKS